MKSVLSIILWVFAPMLTPYGLQIGEVKTNNQTIKIMKMNLNNPAFLQEAGNRIPNYFYIKLLSDGGMEIAAEFDHLLGKFATNLQYSINSVDENDWDMVEDGMAPELNAGDVVYFRNYTGQSLPHSYISTDSRLCAIYTNFDVGGDITSLFYPKYSSVPKDGLKGLFQEMPVVNAKNLRLQANVVGSSAYNSMFDGCTSLTVAPELPATILGSSCYFMMFNGCTSLAVAPKLPATTLSDACYQQMFHGCTSLTVAPELPATTLAVECYFNMFSGCTSLTVAPELPATILADFCYSYMFDGCTSLIVAPKLPAATLVEYCYQYIFNNCINLTAVTCLATDISAIDCTDGWLDNVSENGTFTKATGVDWPTGSSGIPTGWTVVEQ